MKIRIVCLPLGFALMSFQPLKKDITKASPNIVLMVADDHGTDALGCYGNPVIKTPHLDRLAAEGVRFTHAFCTTASCSPSRSAILSGRHNHANGMYGLEHQYHHFSSFDIKTLPVLLAENGYRTARIGKYHVAPEEVYHFQQVLSEGAANNPDALGRNAVAMAERSREFLSAESDKPFFLYFATDDPHRSNTVSPDGKPDFSASGPNVFGNRTEGYQGVSEVKYDPAQVLVPSFLPDTKASREELAQYYQSVSRLDQGVGRLIQILKETEKYENTIIVYISDNGVAFPGAKTTLYDPGIRLPCIVRDPSQTRKGIVSDAMISWVDIAPTMMELAGVPLGKDQFQGRSFRNVFSGNEAKGWDEMYASHSLHEITMYYPMRAIRSRKYKLIYNIAHELTFPMALDLVESSTWKSVAEAKAGVYGKRKITSFLHRPEFELYDLENDPNETQNLAEDPAHQAVFTALLTKLKHFQEET